jgi:hypothetical protein
VKVRVASDRVRQVLLREQRIGQRRVAVDDFQPQSVPGLDSLIVSHRYEDLAEEILFRTTGLGLP